MTRTLRKLSSAWLLAGHCCCSVAALHAQQAPTQLKVEIRLRPEIRAAEIDFLSLPAKVYQVERSFNLSTFEILGSLDGTGSRVKFRLPLVAENRAQFLRISEFEPLISASEVLAFKSPPADRTIPYDNGPLQFGKLRLPDAPGPHPVIIFIHGGCWLSSFNIEHTGMLEQAMSEQGYAVWSLEYRRVGDGGGGWPSTFLDIGRGADHLRSLATEFDLDLTRVVASGHSAGGHLALWLAARSVIPQGSDLYVPDPLPIHAVFGLAPAPDLEGLHASRICGHVIDDLMGGSPDTFPDRYASGSPMQLAPINVPQVFVLGNRDLTWTPVGRAYIEHAKRVGDNRITVVEASASGHFEMIVPTTTTWPLVRDTLAATFDQLFAIDDE